TRTLRARSNSERLVLMPGGASGKRVTTKSTGCRAGPSRRPRGVAASLIGQLLRHLAKHELEHLAGRVARQLFEDLEPLRPEALADLLRLEKRAHRRQVDLDARLHRHE